LALSISRFLLCVNVPHGIQARATFAPHGFYIRGAQVFEGRHNFFASPIR
jgi:hypothetical protein